MGQQRRHRICPQTARIMPGGELAIAPPHDPVEPGLRALRGGQLRGMGRMVIEHRAIDPGGVIAHTVLQ
jgi:hypothetical protein